MRDLTKSMFSFSWAMSLFGMRQMAGMMLPGAAGDAKAAFDHVTRSTEEHLGATFHSLFRSGDRLQREMLDLAFGVVRCGDAGRAPGGQPGAAGAAGGAPPPGPSSPGAGSEPAKAAAEPGWGPMPGRR